MTEQVATRLLEAIATDRLLLVCGAGLSMAPPSNLPSAAAVARACSDTYTHHTGQTLDAEIREDIAQISKHFRTAQRFQALFIGKLVPWHQLTGTTNAGHEALADLLACHALRGAFTTNFDVLVEAAATDLGEPDFRAVVDTDDIAQTTPHRPFLKLHGCAIRSRPSTVWCPEQLTDQPVAQRLVQFRNWIAANVPGRDLVFVGFWTDWSYLTDLLAQHLAVATPAHVYLVDPDTPENLQEKAPALWAWAHRTNIVFHHCRESGPDFLNVLRSRWSSVYINRLIAESRNTYNNLFRRDPDPTATTSPDWDAQTLYALRRDLSGTPRSSVVRNRDPHDMDHLAAAIHQRLLERGAQYSTHRYELAGRSIRVISGRGRLLSQVKATFSHEPPFPTPIEVVCAGSVPDVSPANIVRTMGSQTIVRAGAHADWITHDALVAELQEPTCA